MRSELLPVRTTVAIVLCLTFAPRTVQAEEPKEEPKEEPPAFGVEVSAALPTLGSRNRVAEAHTFGVAGTQTRRHYGGQTVSDGSILASGSHFTYDTRGSYSGRSVGFGFIGGGGAGFEGGFGGELGFGVRIPFGLTHGPIARLAIEGFLMGNDRFYASLIKLPKGEAGYQILTRDFLFEAAATAGLVLGGRYNVETAFKQDLGGRLEVGGHAAFGFRAAHLELALARINPEDDEPGALTRMTGSLCGLPSYVSVCLDARRFDGRPIESTPEARVTYFGIRVGVVTSTGQPRTAKDKEKRKRR